MPIQTYTQRNSNRNAANSPNSDRMFRGIKTRANLGGKE